MTKPTDSHRAGGRYLALAVLFAVGLAAGAQAAEMRLLNLDGPNEGLNDPTPVEPVGANNGDTLGEQRRIALQYAANILGSRIGSSVPIRIAAHFNPIGCDANSSTLGRTAPAQFSADFAGAPRDRVYYPVALANALAGRRIAAGTNDIDTIFNASLDNGNSDCLQGVRWYYGLDSQVPDDRLSFLSTAVHELTHGLGFVSLVAVADKAGSAVGEFPRSSSGDRYPDVFSRFIRDLSLPGQPYWPQLSAEQRADSMTNGPALVWSESNTSSNAPRLLDRGLNQGMVKLYAPPRRLPGSSVSHWDTSLMPNQLMEAFAPRDNTRDEVTSGIGMATCVLQGIGWPLINGTRCPDIDSQAIAGPGSPMDGIDRAATTPEPADVPASDDGSSGGGCTLVANMAFDPLWLVLLLGAGGLLARRQRRFVG